MGRKAFTLVELMIVIAVIALLIAISAGAFGGMRAQARRMVCANQMRSIHLGLVTYAAANCGSFPPFAFNDSNADLPLSGHWGGPSQNNDLSAGMAGAVTIRRGVDTSGRINLWAGVYMRLIEPQHLICPAARGGQPDADSFSYFPYSQRFSTYCLRVPYSQRLFTGAEPLMNLGGGLMGVYRLAAGGQNQPIGPNNYRVPLVRTDLTYPSAASGVNHTADMASDVWLADGFWFRGRRKDAPSTPGLKGYPQRGDWWHGDTFNVLDGNGVVRQVTDNGTIAARAVPPGAPLPTGEAGIAKRAEEIWQFMDARQ